MKASWLEKEIYQQFEEVEIIPVSSHTGKGLDKLKASLRSIARSVRRTKEDDFARLPVDRVFTIKGSGTVITGTLWSGSFSPEDEIEILPQGLKARIRSVQVHGENVDKADAGNRVAINLGGTKTSDVAPGDFLSTPQKIEPSDRFDAFFTYMDTTKSGKPLKSGSRVHVAHGTREVIGRILFMNVKELLRPGESSYVQLRLEEPLALSWRDRFIVRSYSPVHVIGGGKVLLAHPRHRTNLVESESKLLEALHREDIKDICSIAFGIPDYPVTVKELTRFCGLSARTVSAELDSLQATNKAFYWGKTTKTSLIM